MGWKIAVRAGRRQCGARRGDRKDCARGSGEVGGNAFVSLSHRMNRKRAGNRERGPLARPCWAPSLTLLNNQRSSITIPPPNWTTRKGDSSAHYTDLHQFTRGPIRNCVSPCPSDLFILRHLATLRSLIQLHRFPVHVAQYCRYPPDVMLSLPPSLFQRHHASPV